MGKKYAKYLLEKTKKDYNLIAADFSNKRRFIPEDIKDLAGYALKGERILDLGCGNGRLFQLFNKKNVDYYGVDISERLVKIAKINYPQGKFQTANALNLPFTDNFFDRIYSISVLHNIPSKEFQLQYLMETRRILKPKGTLILRVWDFWRRKSSIRLFLKYTFLKILGKSKLDFFDVFVPWKNSKGEIIIERYFHCFRKRELENLVKKAGFKIKKSWRAGKDPRTNIYLIAEK